MLLQNMAHDTSLESVFELLLIGCQAKLKIQFKHYQVLKKHHSNFCVDNINYMI